MQVLQLQLYCKNMIDEMISKVSSTKGYNVKSFTTFFLQEPNILNKIGLHAGTASVKKNDKLAGLRIWNFYSDGCFEGLIFAGLRGKNIIFFSCRNAICTGKVITNWYICDVSQS